MTERFSEESKLKRSVPKRDPAAPGGRTTNEDPVLDLQRRAGNRAVSEILRSGPPGPAGASPALSLRDAIRAGRGALQRELSLDVQRAAKTDPDEKDEPGEQKFGGEDKFAGEQKFGGEDKFAGEQKFGGEDKFAGEQKFGGEDKFAGEQKMPFGGEQKMPFGGEQKMPFGGEQKMPSDEEKMPPDSAEELGDDEEKFS
jgi:hypothetical protein